MKKSSMIALVALVIVVALVAYFFKITEIASDPYSIYYDGENRKFRGNLLEANKTPIYPDEASVENILLSPEVYKIQIAYIPNVTENAFYLASSYELTSKLGLVYRHYYTSQPQVFKDLDNSSCLLFYDDMQTRCFKSVAINSTDDLVPTSVEPVILLLGPSQEDQTSVRVENNLIILSGASIDESNRTYTDLDLSVARMLLTLMA
jgi:hypothetical protein